MTLLYLAEQIKTSPNSVLLVPPIQYDLFFFCVFKIVIKAIKIANLSTCPKGMAFISHLELGKTQKHFSITIFIDFFMVLFQSFLATDNYASSNTNTSIKYSR